ncbi:phosphoribosylformylglycinamidine synthase subunit PurS [Metallumcola ferriviriculae]|uniref:Phosphoribosylformylglycinamidine synthase subunit PurS n=1 Tax=Metallumcola ferriviriculae TaxID=3039180 RepID=A0AAU0UU89_9FIRM|nr:phosphoribosylformylglycinamidine synthase subunit PurS [Desulfitibacteraceae bacterium MK1]
MYRARIRVTLKKGVLDPQGNTVEKSLHAMEYTNVTDVRIGKYMELTVAADNRESAEQQVKEMCQRLLANPVIEEFTFDLAEAKS